MNAGPTSGRYPSVRTVASSGPSVSVIIPTYNSGRWIVDAVRSAIGQDHPPHQVIIVDDGSTDDTAARLGPFGDGIVLERQENRGVAAARNRGLALATGDFIAFLDADDTWHPRKLALQLSAFERDATLGLLGTRTCDCSKAAPDVERASVTPLALERLVVKNYLATSSVMVRREVIERAGRFDTTLQGPEDHDYWIRIAEAGRVGVLDAPLTGYRIVPGSLSRRAAPMESGVRRILGNLDARGFWQGKPALLRRHAYGYAAYASAFLHSDEGDHWRALGKIVESLAWYPLPFGRAEAGVAGVRGRRLGVLLLRCFSGRGRAPRSGGASATHGANDPKGTIPESRADHVQADAQAAF